MVTQHFAKIIFRQTHISPISFHFSFHLQFCSIPPFHAPSKKSNNFIRNLSVWFISFCFKLNSYFHFFASSFFVGPLEFIRVRLPCILSTSVGLLERSPAPSPTRMASIGVLKQSQTSVGPASTKHSCAVVIAAIASVLFFDNRLHR